MGRKKKEELATLDEYDSIVTTENDNGTSIVDPGDEKVETAKVRVVEKYICVKQCFDGKQLIEPKSNVFYTRRQIPNEILGNFKKIKVTEVIDGE